MLLPRCKRPEPVLRTTRARRRRHGLQRRGAVKTKPSFVGWRRTLNQRNSSYHLIMSACLNVCLSVCLRVCLSACLCVRVSVHPPVCLYACKTCLCAPYPPSACETSDPLPPLWTESLGRSVEVGLPCRAVPCRWVRAGPAVLGHLVPLFNDAIMNFPLPCHRTEPRPERTIFS